MIQILLATLEKEYWSNFISGLREYGANISMANSCTQVLQKAMDKKVDLVVIDEMLSDSNGLDCIKKLISIDPMISCAAVSSLSHDAFHEATEGLGVLMQVPRNAGRKEANTLLMHLNNIYKQVDEINQ